MKTTQRLSQWVSVKQCAQTEIPLIVCLYFFTFHWEKFLHSHKEAWNIFQQPHISIKIKACFCFRLKKGIVTSSGKSTENICNYCTYLWMWLYISQLGLFLIIITVRMWLHLPFFRNFHNLTMDVFSKCDFVSCNCVYISQNDYV